MINVHGERPLFVFIPIPKYNQDFNETTLETLSMLEKALKITNRTKTLIIKQLTEIKATVNPTNTLVTYNKNSTDKTTQNSDNVIDKTIQNNNKEPFKNKKNTKIYLIRKL